MRIYRISYYAIFFTILSVIIAFSIPFLVEFFRKRNFYNNVNKIINELDKAYLISEIIENPDFPEGQKFYETLKICNKSMCDKIAEYKINVQKYFYYTILCINIKFQRFSINFTTTLSLISLT